MCLPNYASILSSYSDIMFQLGMSTEHLTLKEAELLERKDNKLFHQLLETCNTDCREFVNP